MVVPDARRRRRMHGHLWPCAERCLGRRRDAGPSVALCGEMLGPEAGCRVICGLVRRDAWAGGGMQGHLRPCAERCLGRRRDAGPSVALCGEMPRRSGGPRAICGLVRTDACGGGRMRGRLWPCAERCRAGAADRGPSVALCGQMLAAEAGCGAVCGLVRKDAAPERRTAGHLWPCADRCLRRRPDAGPSVALYGRMPRRSGGPRAICGLVRTDACGGGRMRGRLWPCTEGCRAGAADRGPSVALCGQMLAAE